MINPMLVMMMMTANNLKKQTKNYQMRNVNKQLLNNMSKVTMKKNFLKNGPVFFRYRGKLEKP